MRLGHIYHRFQWRVTRMKQHLHELRGRRFDSKHGIETGGQVPVLDLDIPDSFKPHAVKYQPAKVGVFLRAMNSLPIKDWVNFAFVDYGCGKGRCLLLATRFDFEKIVGIDLSQQLTEIARRNLVRFMGGRHRNRIEIQICSSADAALPNQPSVYFFYNPFDEHVMAQTLRCIDKLLIELGCEAYAVYVNPRHKEVFTNYGFDPIESGVTCAEEWIALHRPGRAAAVARAGSGPLSLGEKHSGIYFKLEHVRRFAATIAALSLHCNPAYF